MKVAVIGAGFAGLIMARTLASMGYDVVLLEEHNKVGYPPHCTGIVSERVVNNIGGPARETTLASYRGIIVKTDGSEFEITTSQRIYKLDRERLEELLLEDAIARGVRVVLGKRVEKIAGNGHIWAGGEKTQFDLIILAEGNRRRLLTRSLGVNYRPLESVGVNIEVLTPPQRSDVIEVGFDPDFTGRGFYWIVPLDNKTVVGALSLDAGKAQSAADRLASKIGGGMVRRYGGIVVHGPPLKLNPQGSVVVVGDAAGLNKPLTGGGLYPNSEIARLTAVSGDPAYAVREVSRKLGRQHYIARVLLEYPKLVIMLTGAAYRAGFEKIFAGKIDFDEHERLPLMAAKSLHRLAFMLAMITARDPAGALRLAIAGLKSLIL